MPMSSYYAMRIRRRIAEHKAGVTLVFDGELPAEPGQFVLAWLPGVEERPLAVVSSAPFALTIAAVGPFTEAVCALQPGQRLWIRGPYGHGFEPEGTRHLLVGGGCGTASLTLLAARLLRQGDRVIAAIGARSASQLMLDVAFSHMDVDLLVATDDGSAGSKGTVLDAAGPLIDACWPHAVYACGPERMLQAVALRCREAGVACQLSLERTMRCGIGVCGQCNCGGKLVCADGPVFDGLTYLESLLG